MIIDATNAIVGRIGSIVAKKAILGEDIIIVNCEKAVVTGTKQFVIAKFQRKRSMGTHATGPFFPRSPDKMVRKIIRGMLPYKQNKGRNAYKRIMCYNGVPPDFQDKKLEKLTNCDVSKVPNLKFVTIGAVAKILGNKQD